MLTITGEEGQLSLFNDEWFKPSQPAAENTTPESCGSTAPKTKGPTNKKKSAETKPSKVNPPAPVLESVKLGEDWRVHYSANTFNVDFLFLEERRANVESVTLEEIRLKLVIEEGAAELTASSTKWRYDVELKHLYPEAWGQDKGLC